MGEPVSFGRRVSMLAAENPDRNALVFVPESGPERHVTWRDLDRDSTKFAHLLAGQGIGPDSMVVVALPNSPEHVLATIAAWKLGACVLPLSHRLPARELDAILAVAEPTIVIDDESSLRDLDHFPETPLLDVVPQPGKANGSGGSTGRPKVIVDPAPMAVVPRAFTESLGKLCGFAYGETLLMPGPLYHNFPFGWLHLGLFEANTVIFMERFGAPLFVDLVERHRPSFCGVVPTMMKRIIEVPGIHERDLSSMRAVFHTAAPCPPWLKREWIDLVGAERIYEGYGATEAVGICVVRGDEWLARPGTVGRPVNTEVCILGEDGRDLPAGEVGEVFMRTATELLRGVSGPTYVYKGAPPAKSTPDGFTSVGDMGWLDGECYLYIADRRVDLVITGGANVYPAEVEAALTEHREVADVAVVGIADPDWGKRVHAVVQPRRLDAPPSFEELAAHCRERLLPYKVPKTWELVDELPRDEAGKIRRSQLAAERAPTP